MWWEGIPEIDQGYLLPGAGEDEIPTDTLQNAWIVLLIEKREKKRKKRKKRKKEEIEEKFKKWK
jgi:hypothetical protein